MHDYYRLLGVARNASPQVVKLAFEAKMKALADPAYAASAESKREEERLLKEAHVTLSMPAKRASYDAKLADHEAPAASDAARRPAWMVPAAVGTCLALAGGALWVGHSREKERIRIEEERIAMEKETARRRAEIDEERVKELAARREAATELARERNEQLRVQRERAEYDRWRRTQEAYARQGESMRASQERNALYEQRREEERLRREEADRRRQAQSEVDRQKNYLRQQELEEERIRAERHYRAQREAQELEYKRMLEERSRGVQPSR